ncbi:hypothetical protein [Mycobacterium sp.]|uniref:hypothetical protein n=1 Tax=Mycobacterium sp. TaxID=1785 RepID=UPI0033408739|nr:hypothetical protein [Mycobacterium sp.]
MFRILATIAVSGVALAALAVPVSAAGPPPTSIVGFTSSVSTVAYQQPVTFNGDLVEGATKTPVANEPVQIEMQPPGQLAYAPVASGMTGSDGHFTITTPLPTGGEVRALFGGDTDLSSSHSTNWMFLDVAHVPSRLVLDKVPASVPAGTAVTFSGTMEVEVNGTWEPFQGIPLTLTMEPYTSSRSNVTYTTTSGADGRFSLTEPVRETSDWRVDTALNGSYYSQEWFPRSTSADFKWIDGVSRTQVIGFSLPSHDEAHHAYYKGLYATGTVQAWNGNAWIGLAGGWVIFYYRPKGATRWIKDYGAPIDQYGNFRNIVGVHLGTADWQVRVQPTADTLSSTGIHTVTSTVTDQTHFSAADISRRSSGSAIYGQVTDWYNGQVSFSTLRGLKLRLYYQRQGSKTWHYYVTVTSGRDGFFRFGVAKSYGYHFKVVLPAQGPYQSRTSRTL